MWSYDFVFDWCANGQQLKCLTVTDEWTKEGLAIEVDGRIRSGRVIEVLSRLVSERGAPLYLRSDDGPELVSRALLKWIVGQGIETALGVGAFHQISCHCLAMGGDTLVPIGEELAPGERLQDVVHL